MNKEIHNPNLKSIKKIGDNSAVLTIEPIEGGYGTTLGNSLRRVLLGSIKGAAVTAFRIDGIGHEFSTIKGVKEDGLDIVLNVKALRLRSFSENPVEISVSKKGGVITAGDIKSSDQIEVIDPSQVILTIDDPKVTVKVDIIVESGRGYMQLEESTDKKTRPDMIAVDALFSPVTRVRYNVESTRIGQISDLDKLTLTIDTDGSITPEAAFEQAAAILANQYQVLAGATTVSSAPAYGSREETNEEQLGQDIEKLGFTVRTYNALVNNDINTVRDLVSLGETELAELKGFGAKAQEEVREKLAELEF
ncbi:MAG: DNA-directed RNA polymerase subunit alpha [Candidatus Nomurabacteria bacterium]|jgi:DNA-directed RNA polymerase subunit alpha|nr:DNA-directed RNA polymerase subunit alpha [Candidatus Nomurabacteria bacterium]